MSKLDAQGLSTLVDEINKSVNTKINAKINLDDLVSKTEINNLKDIVQINKTEVDNLKKELGANKATLADNINGIREVL
nr:hypothetical protein [Clostridioides sp.]